MADLPSDRLVPDEPPFTSVGMDCFGPFELKRGRTMIKSYGMVFTCLTVRAVYIEVVLWTLTPAFMHCAGSSLGELRFG